MYIYTILFYTSPSLIYCHYFPRPSVCLSAGAVVDPHRRQLHVTLSHQYLPEHHSTLEDLARSKIDPQAPTKWELRLYSRDHRMASSEVREKRGRQREGGRGREGGEGEERRERKGEERREREGEERREGGREGDGGKERE